MREDQPPEGKARSARRGSRRRRAILLAAQASIVAGSVWAWGWLQSRTLLAAGERAPPLTAKTLQGEPFSLDGVQDRRVIVHFWAKWCGACRGEVDMLNELYAARPPGAELIAVVAEESSDPTALEQFVRERGIRYPVVLGSRAAFARYRVRGLPTNYYLDPGLRIRDRSVGRSTRWGIRWRAGW